MTACFMKLSERSNASPLRGPLRARFRARQFAAELLDERLSVLALGKAVNAVVFSVPKEAVAPVAQRQLAAEEPYRDVSFASTVSAGERDLERPAAIYRSL